MLVHLLRGFSGDITSIWIAIGNLEQLMLDGFPPNKERLL